MNSDYEKQLEARIDRELRRLPELAAPATLIPRVMAAIEGRAAVRWYRRPWLEWPLPARGVSFGLLLAVFGGVGFGIWALLGTPGFAAASGELAGLGSFIAMAQNTLNVVAGALVLGVKQLGTGFMIGVCAAVALGYVLCVGLSTLCVRLAFARR
jgi:hypothetical protein